MSDYRLFRLLHPSHVCMSAVSYASAKPTIKPVYIAPYSAQGIKQVPKAWLECVRSVIIQTTRVHI